MGFLSHTRLFFHLAKCLFPCYTKANMPFCFEGVLKENEMISYISGVYAGHSTDAVVIECGGIGFCIRVPETVLNRLPAKNSEFKLYTYLHVKEDAMQLYGFISKEEQEMFELLIGGSGIGPKGALGILSALSMDTLRFAIYAQDAKTIAKAPGIGIKTAQKMILELKDKISLADTLGEQSAMVSAGAVDSKTNANRAEAIEALTALGFSASEAVKAVSGVKDIETLSTEAIIKAALKKTL